MKNGFSLVEVLVAILILSVGILGAAGMQLAAARGIQQSALQTVALQLATDIADAMQARRGQLRSGGMNRFIGIDYRAASEGEPQVPAKLCFGSDCDVDELAAFQIHEWKSAVKRLLPSGRLLVCRDASPWDDGRQSWRWECTGESEDAPIVIKLGWQARNPDGSLVRDADRQFPPALSFVVPI